MQNDELQNVFLLSSYLLSYPNLDYIRSLEEIKEEITELSPSELSEELMSFVKKATTLTPMEIIEIYVNTFDFGKKSNLYVTYMTNGEQRERGMDLLFLKNYYQLNGFNATDKELPDYLPVILEFAGQVDQEVRKAIFERYYSNIKEIQEQLISDVNLYGHIMKTIMLALKEDGITKSVRRSEELCSSSFSG